MPNFQLINWLAVLCLGLATYFNLYWVWGLLFLFWAAQSFQTQSVFLLGSIEKHTNPSLYWVVTLAWVGFGLWYLSDLLTIF